MQKEAVVRNVTIVITPRAAGKGGGREANEIASRYSPVLIGRTGKPMRFRFLTPGAQSQLSDWRRVRVRASAGARVCAKACVRACECVCGPYQDLACRVRKRKGASTRCGERGTVEIKRREGKRFCVLATKVEALGKVQKEER